jgi:hypothetical protein
MRLIPRFCPSSENTVHSQGFSARAWKVWFSVSYPAAGATQSKLPHQPPRRSSRFFPCDCSLPFARCTRTATQSHGGAAGPSSQKHDERLARNPLMRSSRIAAGEPTLRVSDELPPIRQLLLDQQHGRNRSRLKLRTHMTASLPGSLKG